MIDASFWKDRNKRIVGTTIEYSIRATFFLFHSILFAYTLINFPQ